MKKTIFLLFAILPVLTFGQSEFCDKSFGESYFPLEIGFEKHITWGNAFYVEKVTKKKEIGGKEYFKYEQDFRNGTVYDLLLRNQNDTILMYNEVKKRDQILLIAKPQKEIRWETGKVTEIDGSFETPYCNYENLIVVENKYSNGTKEKRYYKKGLGLVAITSKKGIKGICLPNKEEAESLVQPLSYVGCENEADKDKITECTMKSIHSYVIDKLKTANIKPLKEDGILKYKVNIAKTGYVSEVETLNSIPGGNQARKEIKKIIESLPKFIPTKTADKKAVGTNIELSIPIKTK
ncbi:hypothetical protein [Aquimarina aquimarini]|uniref:hypothetical protein n=1 Tax=Aquimarina aquimarini TaxID=1191734 RepID=UPI001F1C94AD|nr:hypothetical protein [Aquimarina aquimarini]